MTNIHSMKKAISTPIPEAAREGLKALGGNIRTARKLQKLGMDELARRAMTTRETLRRLENGHPGVSIGVLAHVLWVLQLEDNLQEIASIRSNARIAMLVSRRLPERIRNTKTVNAGTAKYDF